MKCVYYCCFIVLINSFFCFGSRSYKADKVQHTTLCKKEVVTWKQPVRHNIVDPLPLERKNRKTRSISAPGRDQKRVAEQLKEKFLNSKIAGITELYLFPNDYEYSIVYACLTQEALVEGRYGNKGIYEKCKTEQKVESEKIEEEAETKGQGKQGKEEGWIGNLSEKLKTTAWALIKYKEKKFFIAICGEGTYELLVFLPNCFRVFKNLKTIFLGGICGCSGTNIAVGTLLIPEKYCYIRKTSKGKASDRIMDKEVLQFSDSYVYKKDLITTEFEGNYEFISKIVTCFSESHIETVFKGTNCSSDQFIDDVEYSDSICSELGAEMVIFNMEDGQLAAQCKDHFCDFYAFRVVSDHAGGTPREIDSGGKKLACAKLGIAFTSLMKFLAESN